ncbi:peptide-methionine (S)-S-oxide reductase MsrA [Winogradskyella maritima]|uniref:Peptide methionine sulfoxide reductase MsrA n=1 Tax=Winogradskyella maritima TaxID=1517766 RepID=A0ABV8AGF3_9FLAO|nr:peptide-methionine (S)-S-oxide reductase MsrA [Winogradskyella maritima]
MKNTTYKTAIFGGGCFWCTEAFFQEVKGVINVTSGYSGGNSEEEPTYQAVSLGMTGHAEVVHITYNPEIVTYEELLVIFMITHNPTLLNRQGADIGTQYHSVVFYETPREKQIIDIVFKELQPFFDKPIVTEVSPRKTFFKADEKHQDYYKNNPEYRYCTAVIEPKLSKFRKQYAEMLAQKPA